MSGESEFLEWLRGRQPADDLVTLPVGDDLAVLAWPGEEALLVGADMCLDGRHFALAECGYRAAGRKAMARNLSDCAAMACLPAAAVLTIALPRAATLADAQAVYLGVRDAGDPYYCRVVGGDTATWDGPLAITVAVLGRSAGIAPIPRGKVRPGDGLYVTGPLGGSILGRHLTFEPRVHLARQLARFGPMGRPVVSGMMDLSDGLSVDLPRLLAGSGCGADLDADRIPIHADAALLAARTGRPAIEHALHDGEDYELLFACPLRPPDGVKVGVVTADAGVRIGGRPLVRGGWDPAMGV